MPGDSRGRSSVHVLRNELAMIKEIDRSLVVVVQFVTCHTTADRWPVALQDQRKSGIEQIA